MDDPWANAPDPRGNPAGVRQRRPAPRPTPPSATRPLPFGGLGTDPATIDPAFPRMGVPIRLPTGVGPPAGSQPDAGVTVGHHLRTSRSRLLSQPAPIALWTKWPATPVTPASRHDDRLGAARLRPGPAATQRPGTTAATTPTTPRHQHPATGRQSAGRAQAAARPMRPPCWSLGSC